MYAFVYLIPLSVILSYWAYNLVMNFKIEVVSYDKLKIIFFLLINWLKNKLKLS